MTTNKANKPRLSQIERLIAGVEARAVAVAKPARERFIAGKACRIERLIAGVEARAVAK